MGFALIFASLMACGDSSSQQTIDFFEPRTYGEWEPPTGPPPACPANSPEAVIQASHPLRGEARSDMAGALETVPLDTVSLRALMGRDISRVRWRIARRPNGSTAALEGADQAETSIWMQLAGRYVVELDVWNEAGLQSCEPARITLEAVPDQDIHIQMVWHTPADDDETDRWGADVDLHLLHPWARGQWGHPRWDCHWKNPLPDWGERDNPDDDPSLDIDDIDGAGPENINLDNPEPGAVYRVGVRYHSDHAYGASFATVRVYIRGVLTFESPPTLLENRDRWEVADIAWPSGRITVLE